MYLSGPINFRFPDGHTESLIPGAPMTWLRDFLNRGGVPLRADGTPYSRSQILGGELFDSCPVNVILADGQWLPEQLDAAKSNPAVMAAVQSCRYFPQPDVPVNPQLIANNAPTAGGSGESIGRTGSGAGPFTPTGVVYTPTGVATPTIITLPEGGTQILPPQPAPEPAPAAAGFGWLPLLLLGGAAVFMLGGRKGKRG